MILTWMSSLGMILSLSFIISVTPAPRKGISLPPVVLVPGYGGAQFKAKLTGKPETVHYWCSRHTDDFFDLWLNLELFLPAVIDCWVDNMKLIYNITTNKTSNMPGVLIEVPGFRNTNTVEWLDTSKASEGRYFTDIVEALLPLGYRRGKNIVGAPYDWRQAPNELQEYYSNLTELIEETSRTYGQRKVIIIAHSMGNPVMLYFYNNIVTQEWKDKFIRSHISIAGAWGGSLQIIRLLASGYNMNQYRILLPPSSLREMQRSFTSSTFLFPNYNIWSKDEVFATVSDKNYTLKNVEEFFQDINYEVGWYQYQNTAYLLGNFKAPNVAIHCIYGYDIETPELFQWSPTWFPDYQPHTIYGDGDGTVNLRSLEACKKWIGKNGGKKISTYAIKDGEHVEIMSQESVIKLIKNIVLLNS
ncbi:Lecithin:cholesterol acyltransferase [Onchocerca flexuosa]|uniref:Lecithin:cholesterol acyltransferase n=1 Tax=Onchocerca flexuosa TaxID=387005 RepID=A0A238C4Q0_9BILA|nr:Lecithin:cholesterol acyltransferase [Onchocerca flexuosa]